MSDQLSKVVAEMREKATALAAACEEHKPAKNMGDLALLDVLPAVAETLIDWADRIESAAAPVEVDGLTPYARCVAAINSLDDFARMDTGVDPAGPRAAAFSALDELARQLAESESALAAATRRVAEVEVALDHIARVGMGSRNKTKRTQWIIARAISTLNGDENWRGQKTPHGYHDALEAGEPK